MMRTARLRRNAGMAGVNGQVSFSSRPQSSCFPASHQARRFVRFRALRLTAYLLDAVRRGSVRDVARRGRRHGKAPHGE